MRKGFANIKGVSIDVYGNGLHVFTYKSLTGEEMEEVKGLIACLRSIEKSSLWELTRAVEGMQRCHTINEAIAVARRHELKTKPDRRTGEK